MIRRLAEAGADAFRVNMSHGTHADHAKRIETIRALEKELERPTTILADLQGPKLRVGQFEGGKADAEEGPGLRLRPRQGARRLRPAPSLPHKEIFGAVEPGTRLLVDDGKLVLRVTEGRPPTGSRPWSRSAARISNNKGLNVPDVVLPLAALTDKDRADLAFALDQGVDWIALSFVQRPEDVAEARRLIAGRAALLAKIEKPAAIDRLEGILELADAVMVARGDLGVEMPPEQVPPLQKTDRRGGAADGPAGGGRDADARIDDLRARRRPAPKSPTSPPRSMTAPTRSCCRPRAPRASSRARRSR